MLQYLEIIMKTPASITDQYSIEDPEHTNASPGSTFSGTLSQATVVVAFHIVAFDNRTLPVFLTCVFQLVTNRKSKTRKEAMVPSYGQGISECPVYIMLKK